MRRERNPADGHRIVRRCAASLLLIASVSCRSDALTTDRLAIRMNDQLIGHAETIDSGIDPESGEREVLSRVRLRIALGDQVREIAIDGRTRYDAQGAVRSYLSHARQSEVWSEVDCTFDGRAVTISRRDSSGAPATTSTRELPDSWALLGSNDFGHFATIAERLAKVEGDSIALGLFTPEGSGAVVESSGRRVASTERDPLGSQRWSFDDLTIVIDSTTGRFLALEIPSQATRVERADASIVDEFDAAAPVDLLARHFIRSPVRFDDPTQVTRLVVDLKVRVIGSGVENPASILTTPMQSFDGEKQQERVTGRLTVSTIERPAEGIASFPIDVTDESLQRYLRPEPLIESDADEIIAKAKSLIGDATDRWTVTEAIGRWTFESIRYRIAETPSALAALRSGEGDCGPHATLTVAMLRSLGIPARLVGGLVYTPSFGGSFGQHAWVEVHLGDAGWFAFDPTTGEFDRLSATHLKLFEGMGGVIPETIEVIDHAPREAPPSDPIRDETRELPYRLGERYRYEYRVAGKVLGEETFEFAAGEGDSIVLEADVELGEGLSGHRSHVRITARPDGSVRRFDRTIEGLLRSTLECEFGERVVTGRNRANLRDRRLELEVDPSTRFFDNNLISSFALMSYGWVLEQEGAVSVETYHASTMTILRLTFRVGPTTELTWGDRTVAGRWCDVEPISNRFFFDTQGRLLRIEQGSLVIELDPEAGE